MVQVDLEPNRRAVRELTEVKKIIEDLIFIANREDADIPKDMLRASKKQQSETLLHRLLLAEAEGQEHSGLYQILNKRGYWDGIKRNAFLQAIVRLQENPHMSALSRVKLNSKEKDQLLERFPNGNIGYKLLKRILKEKGYDVPKSSRVSDKKVWSEVVSAVKGRERLVNDMKRLEEVFDSSDTQDDIDYITGKDSHKHIQKLLYVAETEYRDIKTYNEEVTDKPEMLQKIEQFFGKLAYLAKYINDNLEPRPHLRVSSNTLDDMGFSYQDLDRVFSELLSERVRTILADPRAGDEDE